MNLIPFFEYNPKFIQIGYLGDKPSLMAKRHQLPSQLFCIEGKLETFYKNIHKKTRIEMQYPKFLQTDGYPTVIRAVTVSGSRISGFFGTEEELEIFYKNTQKHVLKDNILCRDAGGKRHPRNLSHIYGIKASGSNKLRRKCVNNGHINYVTFSIIYYLNCHKN